MLIQIKVIPKASQNAIMGFENGILKIKCTAVAEKGKANESVIALLAKHYKVSKSAIKIIKGKTSSRKTVEIKLVNQ